MGCAGSTSKDATEDVQGSAPDEEEEDFNPLTDDELTARIVCSKEPELFKLGDSGITLRYAYLSQRGYYPEDLYKANQDSFKVVRDFNGRKDQILFGVFDGHGVDGDHCSYFVRDNIEQELIRQLAKYPEDFERAYKESFIAVNNRMHAQVRAAAGGGAGLLAPARPWHLCSRPTCPPATYPVDQSGCRDRYAVRSV